MLKRSVNESTVEEAYLAWLESLDTAVLHGSAIAAGELAGERNDPNCRDVVLVRRRHQVLVRLYPGLPPEALGGASCKLTLAALRNALLPKLLSGEIRVEGAEKSVEKHTWAN